MAHIARPTTPGNRARFSLVTLVFFWSLNESMIAGSRIALKGQGHSAGFEHVHPAMAGVDLSFGSSSTSISILRDDISLDCQLWLSPHGLYSGTYLLDISPSGTEI